MESKNPQHGGQKKKFSRSESVVTPEPPQIYRLFGFPLDLSAEKVRAWIEKRLGGGEMRSLAVNHDLKCQVATALIEPKFFQENGLKCEKKDIIMDATFKGLTVLRTPEPSKGHEVDIIAICGLEGHAFNSFVDPDSSHMWLLDRLPEDFETARIMTYGYDSTIAASESFQDLEGLGAYLRNVIDGVDVPYDKHGNKTDRKPMIFIAHSLGGLILKEAILVSSPRRKIRSHTYSALFFGVPNHGMDMSSLIPMAYGQANAAFLHSLQRDSRILRRQEQNFIKKFWYRCSKVRCFYETKLSPTARKVDGEWRTDGPPLVLVGENSATHCRHFENDPQFNQSLDAAHVNLIRLKPYDPAYDCIKPVIQESIEDLDTMDMFERKFESEEQYKEKMMSLRPQSQTQGRRRDVPRIERYEDNPEYPDRVSVSASDRIFRGRVIGEEVQDEYDVPNEPDLRPDS